MPALRRSASSASATPGYWIFTATAAAVGQLGAVDLADRGGGERLLLDLGEQLVERLAVVLLLEHLCDLLPRHRRRVGAELRELLLVDLAVLGRRKSVSMKEASWPIFIAAPFICPRAPTIFIAVSRWRCLEPLLAASSERTTLAALVPGVAGALDADAVPSLAERRIRPWGSSIVVAPSETATPAHWSRQRATCCLAPFLYPLPSDGDGTRNPESRSPRGVRLAQRAPPAPRGPRARRRLRGGSDARSFQVAERELRAVLAEGQALFDLEIEGSQGRPGRDQGAAAPPGPRRPQHIDLQRCSLDEEIQAEVAIELEGAEDAPGVKEGGVLEHVTREITVEALPTEIPERIIARRLRRWRSTTPSTLAPITVPGGVKFIADEPEEITIATLSPPRVEESPSPRSRRRPSWSARRARRRPRARAPPRSAEGEGDSGDSGRGE